MRRRLDSVWRVVAALRSLPTMREKPMRAVVKEHLRGGGSVFASFKFHWWELDLECGHTVERRCRYAPDPTRTHQRRGFDAMHKGASLSRLLDAPKRAACHVCAGVNPNRHS